METPSRWYRPAPDALLLTGAAVALLGYLVPWFRISERYLWSYSGWNYLTLSTGGGWTWWPVFFLVIAIGASLWARRVAGLAMLAVGAAVAGMFLAGAVVAVSLGALPERSSTNWVGELPVGTGLPLMAVGFGCVVAGAVAAARR